MFILYGKCSELTCVCFDISWLFIERETALRSCEAFLIGNVK